MAFLTTEAPMASPCSVFQVTVNFDPYLAKREKLQISTRSEIGVSIFES
jgi:hypothetical protein